MMKLLIDSGNSCMKMALQRTSALELLAPIAYREDTWPQLLRRQWAGIPAPDRVCVANVAGPRVAAAIQSACAGLWGVEPEFVEVTGEWNGVVTAYQDYRQLGIDRWLAVIAAWLKYRGPACVVDCGTALTIDLINAQGRHEGGWIIPGPGLMQDSLGSGTHALQSRPDQQDPGLAPGTSTTACIGNGAARAIAAVIDRTLTDAVRDYGDGTRLVLTGGYGAWLRDTISSSSDWIPTLVLDGLAAVVA